VRRRTKKILMGVSVGGLLLFAASRVWGATRRRSYGFWDFSPPLDKVEVTSGWLEDRGYRNGVHLGLDMRGKVGDPVYSIADGVVTKVRDAYGGSHAGMYVEIQHPNGAFSRYLHLDSNNVKTGQRVVRGEQIGRLGRSAMAGRNAISPHLHFGMAISDDMLDEFVRRYGKPSTGFTWHRKMPGTDVYTKAVPGEALIPGAYRQRTFDRAKKYGFKMHPEATVLSGALGALAHQVSQSPVGPTLSIV
jgi:murein DD-endopeptidase MepM/ murein hydrolase activator NlpD